MIRNIVFDFGGVLVDWNPHRVFDPYFGSPEKASWFLDNICTREWNGTVDKGKPFAEAVAELSAVHPEWSDAIETYMTCWKEMMGGAIPGMYDLIAGLKRRGYPVYGLTNWSAETFYQIVDDYPVFSLLDGRVVSGEVHLLKPDAAIYRCLLETFGLEASESVFIDDNADNVLGARAVGLEGILFRDAPTLAADLEKLLAG